MMVCMFWFESGCKSFAAVEVPSLLGVENDVGVAFLPD